MTKTFSTTVAGQEITLEFGKYARFASGVMVTSGKTQVLVTVAAADETKPGQDFLPLTVDYVEKFYAAGKIPGNFFKRENRAGHYETLIARVIDRSLRPRFAEGFLAETFITCTVVSLDPAHHPAPLALLGASVSLMISDVPFAGPVACLRLGMEGETLVVDPPELKESRLAMTIAAAPGSILMVEAGADFLTEAEILKAIQSAHEMMEPLFEIQLKAQREVGVPKRELPTAPAPSAAETKVAALAKGRLGEIIGMPEKKTRNETFKAIRDAIVAEVQTDAEGVDPKTLKAAVGEAKYDYMRRLVLAEGTRIDGRKCDEVRRLECEVGILRRPHGSALFQRGETQALGTVTLGSGDDEQRVDSATLGDFSKRFSLHYNFPPYSVGEAKPLRGTSRRELGHGALAERALGRALPGPDRFGYTVRLVVEILQANGSSSMATVCSGTMALLHAGVPLKQPIAGIAMGLIKEGDDYRVLSDINDDEDHLGDMDFKVCGSDDGITALQMDNKAGGLTSDILAAALEQAKAGRRHILKAMRTAISDTGSLSLFAPRIFQVDVRKDRIRDLIGPGGKMIRYITEQSGARIQVGDDDSVTVTAPDIEASEKAIRMIKEATSDPEIGQIFRGTVRSIVEFGAFIEIKPGLDGLCHISEIANHRVERVEDELTVGQEVMVKVLNVDRQGRIKLSRREAEGKN